jgi:hypothetical protein
MQAIQAIVDTYVRLRNEAALLALKQQRLKVLATFAPNDPLFAKLRNQCMEEISEINAGIEKLRPAPIVPRPSPNPSPPKAPPATKASGPPPLPAIEPLPARAPATINTSLHPTPIDPSPFVAKNPSPPIPGVPPPLPTVSAPSSIKPPTEPPRPFASSHAAPSLLASSLLAASLSSKLPANGEKVEPELMRLQIALEERMKSKT